MATTPSEAGDNAQVQITRNISGNSLMNIFQVSGRNYEVELNDAQLQWKSLGSKNGQVSHIPIADIVGSRIEQSKDQKSTYLSVYYIKKNGAKLIWKCGEHKLQHADDCVIQQWHDHIHSVLSNDELRPKSLLVFVNPMSGSKKGVQVYEKYTGPVFKLAGIKTNAIVTKSANHVVEVLEDYDLSSIDGIVCVGGDGTFTLVVNGLLKRLAKDDNVDLNDPDQTPIKPDLRIGIIPCGTGQGMSKVATGTIDPVTSALHIITGAYQHIDIVSVRNGDKFETFGTMLACYGYFGDSIRDSESHRHLGKARYPYAMIKALMKHRLVDVEIQYRAHIDKQALNNHNDRNHNGASASIESVNEDEWRSVCGKFRGVNSFLFDIEHGSLSKHVYQDSLLLYTIGETVGRIGHLRHLIGLASENINTFSNACIHPYHHVKEYRLILKNADLNSHTEVFNVDGEPIWLTDPVVHVKFHLNYIKFFGQRDAYLRQQST